MRLSIVVTWSHYWAHLAPIWRSLPEDCRGKIYAPSDLAPRIAATGDGPIVRGHPRDGALLVAGWSDSRHKRGLPVALVDHGVGMSYQSEGALNPAYNGGTRREHISLFLYANERARNINAAVYPNARHEVVGAPILDRWHLNPPKPSEPPAVAVTFHWYSGSGIPEAQGAFSHYEAVLAPLRDACEAMGARLVGHGHPRFERRMRAFWKSIDVPWWDYEQVMDEASVLVVDNSSIGPEVASTGRPIVWLSAPFYRRDVHHGARFWQWIDAGEHVEEPDQLMGAVERTLANPDAHKTGRDAMVRDCYFATDGKASQRAADALVSWLEDVS